MTTISNRIYFDNNRSTKIAPEVAETMESSEIKDSPRNTIEQHALQQAAEMIGCKTNELAFTSGTSLSITVGIDLLFNALKHKGRHIITCLTEHPAVLNACLELQKQGAEISYLKVNPEGLPDPDELKTLIRNDTILLCLMAANNETGVLMPMEEMARICHKHKVLLFSDASQFVGKQHCDTSEMRVDAMAFGSHKMYGPPGVAALYIRGNVLNANEELQKSFALLKQQQQSIDAKLMAGFGKAASVFVRDYWEMSSHISRLKNYLEHQLLDIEGLRINGSTRNRIYTTSNLLLPEPEKIRGLLARFEFLSNHNRRSHVLLAMGLSEEESKSSFRFSFGKFNTLDEVKMLVEEILHLYKTD